MSFKGKISGGLKAVSRLPGISSVLFHPSIRGKMQSLPGAHVVYGRGWELLHPFDSANGIDTSGYVAAEDLPQSPLGQTKSVCYAGSQPSVLRAALKSLPPMNDYTFIDLGAGKGRPIIVASEFPFREVIGVELFTELAQVGQKNLEIVRQRHSGRAPMRIENGDAATFQFPDGNFVLFLYNPFGADVTRFVLQNAEEALRSKARKVFVVYYNPVHGGLFDESPLFERYLARTFPYSAEECGFGYDDADPVIVWQAGAFLDPLPGADAAIRITKADYRAELDPA
jgi:hypothetical protein